MTLEFTWSWMEPVENTKNKSNAVLQDNGTVYTFRQTYAGQINSKEMNAFVESTAQRFQSNRSNWRNYIRPILNSLPAGASDSRWTIAAGSNLPEKIDCFKYGVQGSTLFVFNDANASKADGRYWVSTQKRPKTIAEKFEDIYSTIFDLQDSLSSSGDIDLDSVWSAIGLAYRDDNKVATAGSLDSRITTLNTYMNQLNEDIYDPDNFSTALGTSLTYSIAEILDYLLKLHDISGWQDDPSNVSHDSIVIPSHTHSYTNIKPAPGQSIVQGRVSPYTTLDNDIKRLRYEIADVKGSTWNSSPTDPVTASSGDLLTHMNYAGSGVRSTNNPHAMNYSDIGLGSFVSAVQSYTGMTSMTDTSPSYSSTYNISNGDDLVTAIGKIDTALQTAGYNVTKIHYTYDRSSLSETERENTPIVINHNQGKKPVVSIIDISPGTVDYYGLYQSPETWYDLLHRNDNTFEVRSNASKLEIIAIY